MWYSPPYFSHALYAWCVRKVEIAFLLKTFEIRKKQPTEMKNFVFDVSVCLLHLPTSYPFFFNEAIQNHLNATWLVNTSAGMETDMRN